MQIENQISSLKRKIQLNEQSHRSILVRRPPVPPTYDQRCFFFFNTYSNHLFHPELRVRKLLGPFSKQIPVFGPFFNVRMLFALCCTSPIDPANYKMENKRCPPNTGVQSFLFATQSLNKRVNSWKLTAIE